MNMTKICSFHHLKDEIGGRAAMAENAGKITERLGKYLEFTEASVQMRSGKPLDSTTRKTLNEMKDKGERRLGLSILTCWNISSQKVFLPDLCPRLLQQQVPLAAMQGAERWGKIDLMGMSAKGEPVVIELKAKKAPDSPLRAMIEAVGYAVAIRKNWPEYQPRLERPSNSVWAKVDPSSNISVVVLAPTEFWQKLDRSKISRKAITALVELEKGLSNKGYPVRFSSINASIDNMKVSDPRFWEIKDGYWPFV